jgi:tetratricopeptide (TPR) repeat protein
MPSKQIFISYASTDKAQADSIREFLERHGHSCFMAPRDIPGGRWWPEVLLEALYAAEIVVLVFSERGNLSPQIAREVSITVHRKIPLIPYRIENVLPRGLMEYFLCLPQWLDDFSPLSPEKSEQLLAAVRRGAEQAAAPPEASPSAKVEPPLSASERQRLTLLVAQAMIEEAQPLALRSRFSTADCAALDVMVAAGELREVQGADTQRYLGFKDEESCLAALAAAVDAQPGCPPAEWLARCSQFPLLADAIGKSADQVAARQYASLAHGMVQRVMQSFLTHRSTHAKRLSALEALLPMASAGAIEGCKQAALDQAGQSANLAAASELLAAIERGIASRESDLEFTRLAIELANERGRILRRQQQFPAAIATFRSAQSRAAELGGQHLLAVCTTNLCRAELDAAAAGTAIDRQAVVSALEENIRRLEALGNEKQVQRELAVAWNNLGDALAPLDPARAEECLRKDVQFAEELNDLAGLVDALNRLGVHLADQQRGAEAIAVHQRERQLFAKLFDFEREARCLANLGRAHFGQSIRGGNRGDLTRAIEILEESRDRYGKLNRPPELATVLENLGKARWMSGDAAAALVCLRECIAEHRRWPGGEAAAQRLEREIEEAGA